MSVSRFSFDVDEEKVEYRALGHTRIKKDALLREDGEQLQKRASRKSAGGGRRSCVSQGTKC